MKNRTHKKFVRDEMSQSELNDAMAILEGEIKAYERQKLALLEQFTKAISEIDHKIFCRKVYTAGLNHKQNK